MYEVNNVNMITLILDKTLTEMSISRYELSKRTGINYQIIDNYYKNKVKRYDGYVLNRICEALDCPIEKIIKYSK
ncbi:MAG: helix-turn-helix transcriptional regulator [Ruminococcaceae bacterium]|nr:helix-turn-helix transcriptional regulator [Oscillospiraceae bacterium]